MTRLLLPLVCAIPSLLPGQTPAGTCASPFEVPLKSDHRVSMYLRSGNVEIVGTERPGIRVTCTGYQQELSRIRISFAAANLRTYGGPDHSIRFRIEVPARTNLLVRLTAGDLQLSGVTGDKDVRLRAGDLTIRVDHPEEYRVAEGSVMAGDLRASAFGVTKDGLFRSFRKDNAGGRYRLRAELLAGDLTLR